MSRVQWKGSTLLGPLPAVMVTCKRKNGDNCGSPADVPTSENTDGGRFPSAANVFTAAWCGIVATHPPRLYVSIRPSRYSYNIIKETREFVVNLTPSALAKTCDYVGTVTGRCVDKIKKTGLTLVDSTAVECPTIAESPLSLECRVADIIAQGSHDMFIADIVAVTVDEALLDDSGKLRLDRANLCAFAHGEYFELGKKIGKIGFGIGKKKRKSAESGGKKRKFDSQGENKKK